MIEKKKKKGGPPPHCRHLLSYPDCCTCKAKSYPDSRTDLIQDFGIFIRIKSISGQNSKILSEVGAPTARPLDDFRGS